MQRGGQDNARKEITGYRQKDDQTVLGQRHASLVAHMAEPACSTAVTPEHPHVWDTWAVGVRRRHRPEPMPLKYTEEHWLDCSTATLKLLDPQGLVYPRFKDWGG